MEAWSFGSEGKAFFFSEEMDIPMDAFSRSRKTLLEWDNKSCFNFDKESVESMGFMELGFPDSVRKPFHGNQGLEILNGVIVNDSSSNTVASPTCLITPSSSLGEGGESWSKFSSPVTEFNTQDSSLIALKLGSLADSRDGQNDQHLKDRPKRAGERGPYSHTPTCQVYGCHMDLSSSKDYHKRHRVCDAHSKTPIVIVNGIEQRFCQQCSRFHLLAEFDDAKRSCRRRLAGHNQRRRKPQIDTLNCKPRKLLRSCQGTKYLGNYFPKRTPFVFSGIFPGGILYPEEYEQANRYGHIKSEYESAYRQCVTSIANKQLVPKSFHGGLGKQHALGSPSSENEYLNFDTPSSIQKVYGASNSSCALSLLSAQSHNLSGHSAGVHVPSPSLIHQSVGQMESIMVSDSSHTIDFQAHTDRGFQDSDCLSTKYGLSPQRGPTFDLLHLSSHLQRVEHERNFLQVKQENGEFYCFPTSMQATM